MFMFSSYCRSEATLAGKTAVITGGNCGIGKEVVKDFYNRGAKVVILCRKTSQAEQIAKKIERKKTDKQNGQIIVKFLDLSSLSSVRKCAEEILKSESRIDILVNNAGVLTNHKKITEDDLELTFVVNYLGHFLLTMLLLPKIIDSGPSRIINVNSKVYSWESMTFEDLNYKIRTFNPFKAYCESKLALILFTNELSRKLKGTKVTVYSLHPGIVNTKMARNLGVYNPILKFPPVKMTMGYFMKTIKQGAQTIIHCAVDEKVQNETGCYYVECKKKAMKPKALDENAAKKLWDMSLRMSRLG